MRVDNGSPWGTQSPVPSALALWLIGLGVEVIYNRPRRSTDNGIVERAHGVMNQWVEPQQCADLGTCQQRLQQAIHWQRATYPACDGQSRLVAYPDLEHNLRSCQSNQETQMWQMERIYHYLGQQIFYRKVEKNGRATIFSSP